MKSDPTGVPKPRGEDIARSILTCLAIALAYVVFAKIGFSLAFATKQVTAVWPPAGIAVAALLLFGYRVWPGVWLGAFVSNAITHEPLYTAAGIAVGNTLGPILGVYIVRLLGFNNALERLRDVIQLVAFASVLAMTVTATNGVLNLALARIVPWNSLWEVWRLWWTGDAMGVLLVAPLILSWSTVRWPVAVRRRRVIETGALIVALVVTTWLSFMSHFPLGFPVFPFIIWTGLRYGQRATTLAVAAIAAIAIWGTTHGSGPFTGGSLDHKLIMLVTFMAVLALTGLVLGAVMSERRLAEAQLWVAEKRFQVLAEIVPQMVWTADATGWIDWYNHRWYEYTGQTPEEAAGWGWQRAHHPEDFPRVMQDWPRSIATGAPFDMESRIQNKDGTFRWFLMRAEPRRDVHGAVVRWYGTNTDIDDQKRTLQQTTRVAEALQAAFLPSRFPNRPDVTFDALYLSAEREALVGGDWYDAFELPDRRIVVSIGDVIGHGVSAAVTAGRIRQGIYALALDTTDPATILTKVNRILQLQEVTLATALVAVIEPDLTRMRYASAGHPPPIIANARRDSPSMPNGGLPLGVEHTLKLETHSVELERDAAILFYTDGVTEFNRNLESAEQALRSALAGIVGDTRLAQPAAALQRAVMGAEKPTDDAVLMLVQLAPGPIRPPLEEPTLRKTWTFHSSDAYSARSSRHELMSFIRRFIADENELFRIELVIGEILANTVEHAPGLVTVETDWSGSRPTMIITDTGPGLLRFAPRLPESELTEDGRGLFLIATFATEVSVESTPDGGTKMTVVMAPDQTAPAASSSLTLKSQTPASSPTR